MNVDISGPKILFEIGSFQFNETMLNMLIVSAIILAVSIWLTHGMKVVPSKKQSAAEIYVTTVNSMVEQTMGKGKLQFAPYIGTLFLFSLLSSLLGLFGLRPPTGDLNVTAGWAIMTVCMVHFNGIKVKGFKSWLKGFAEPIPLILPLNIISEIATPVSLAFRHFGNIAAGLVITQLIYGALGSASAGLSSLLEKIGVTFLKGIPILQVGIPAILSIYFDLFTAGLQAFIFCMLTMVFISMQMDD